MAGKPKKGKGRPKTAINKKGKGKKPELLDADRPHTAPSADEQAAFLQLKYEIYGMSLYQQIAPTYNYSYFPKVTNLAMKKSTIGGAAASSGKKKGKGKKKK